MKRKIWNFNHLVAVGLIVCGAVLIFIFGAWKTEAKVAAARPHLKFHTESIEALLEWFDDGLPAGAIPELTLLPTNRLMEQMVILRERGDVLPFADALAAFAADSSRSTHTGYMLAEAYSSRKQLSELVDNLTDPAVTRHIWRYVADFFPDDFPADGLPPYEVFLTATGWNMGDAMVFSYDTETYEIADGGKPVIMFNLTLVSSLYGDTVERQVGSFQDVMAHELFHALLSDYRAWRQITLPQTVEERALFALYNEGIAHYLADGEFVGRQGDEMKERERVARNRYEEQWLVICDPTQPDEIREAALQGGIQASSYWDKYIAVTGLFMAAYIERHGGRELLRECIARGPEYFVETWQKLN